MAMKLVFFAVLLWPSFAEASMMLPNDEFGGLAGLGDYGDFGDPGGDSHPDLNYHGWYNWTENHWAVRITDNAAVDCGGILLNEKNILTSASCVNRTAVREGKLTMINFDHSYLVTYSIVHSSHKTSKLGDDLAVLHVDQSMEGNPGITMDGISDANFDKLFTGKNSPASCYVFTANTTEVGGYPGLLMMKIDVAKGQLNGGRKNTCQTKAYADKQKKKRPKLVAAKHLCATMKSKPCEEEAIRSAPGWALGCYNGANFKLVGMGLMTEKKAPNKQCNKDLTFVMTFIKLSKYRAWIEDHLKTHKEEEPFNYDDYYGTP